MKLPANVKAERDRYVKKFPVPQIPPQTPETIDSTLREWTIRLGRQVRFATGDPRWGCKRADPGRPISKDSIAFLEGPVLHMWDLLTGASSGQGTVNPDPDSLDVPIYPATGGQTFEPVEPLDSLGPIVTPPLPPTTPIGSGRRTVPEWLAAAVLIDRLYQEILHRPLKQNDLQGEANWLSHWREDGRDEAWLRARIREAGIANGEIT